LRILVEDEKMRKKLRKDSIKFVEENHDSERNARKILKLYEDTDIDLKV